MSALNLRDYNLELELSIPESIPCTKRDVWFPIIRMDFPTFEVIDYIVYKKGVYKIHCSMFIKTDNDIEIKQCLEDWCQRIYDNLYVTSVIKGYSKDNGELMLKKIKCTKTFIWQLREDSMCGEKYIDFTFICDEIIEDKE